MGDLTYCFAIGPDELAYQGKYLLQSIQSNTSASSEQIVIYVVESEKSDIADGILKYIKENATIIEGEMPNSEYPLSAAHAALLEASRHSEDEYLLLLDSDTVVLDQITVHKNVDADLHLVPAHKSTFYWADLDRSYNDWQILFKEYGFEFPTERVSSTSDGGTMLPYFNGGTILTKNNDFPRRWKQLSDDLHGTLPEANYFTEMVALALLASDYDVNILSDKYNYMFSLHKHIPDDVKIIHYYDTINLLRAVRNQTVKNKLKSTDVLKIYHEINPVVRKYEIFLSYCNATEYHQDSVLDYLLLNYYRSHKKGKRAVSILLDKIGLKTRAKRVLQQFSTDTH